MKFSQKIGKTPVRQILQIESIDERLENRIWNAIHSSFFYKIRNVSKYGKSSERRQIYLLIWKDFFCQRVDEVPSQYESEVLDYIKDWFFDSKWYEKYDFVEYIAKLDKRTVSVDFSANCNFALRREMSGYRLIEESIVQITSEEEIVEIETALANSSLFKPVHTHLKTAVSYFSNRETPDYRNSIKESISAVESLCVIITDNPKATLGEALKVVEEKYKIHGALKKAFSSLYGYSSNSGGIRHSLLTDDIVVSMEDAKFMLVSCSAFINYLKVKIDK